ncbi:U3 small nucleolar ribonucleoprotein IMP3, putative [Entamoeba dispar SAW760]|uniref:U3 small nucleolar ribonucleoprotein IMP3, putative n=1 Tax=Entamoeba dispar (strain ATCC PRA-260 / SAW760) TaxID=370354 RepID=B0EPG7_ENTDS|nr:U3 small nucleolar ribonucleoprotein IMP3, putative [Entamoeba dispar SAW760]EDR23575.1 U3 small nucleolar ribonucleoprotein IMP3, putative [Entamoeba dispar SAW760]|eukprot:EDR23575.1 U3 small nucleolar ribonucleoprotein IMP3, putative [Entamoeba dispar SAW760]
MVRKLKYHESKLLKKVDFVDWSRDKGIRKAGIMARFHIHDESEFEAYEKAVLNLRKLSFLLQKLPKDDAFRMVLTKRICDRLYDLGVIILPEKGLHMIDVIHASDFCRRRLAIVVKAKKMVTDVTQAETLIQQGHIKVGPDVIRNPAYIVSRKKEDFVTWDDESKMRRKINEFKSQEDDYDLGGID